MAYVYTQNGTSDITSGASAGRVGIGTGTPATDLHVYASSRSIKLDVSSGAYPRIKIEGGDGIINRGSDNHLYFGESADTGNYYFRGTGRVGIGTSSVSCTLDIRNSSNDNVIRLNQDNASKYWDGLALARQSTEKWFIGINNSDEKLRFRRNASSDDVVIDTSGNVGIGTTTPTYNLHIYGTDPKIYVQDASGSVTIRPSGIGGSDAFAVTGRVVCLGGGGNFDDVVVDANHDLIVSLGRVGIGTTTSPSETLDINGAICIKDGMTAPSTHAGKASIYIDSADGDLKIKFGDGTVKTIVTD